MCWKDTLLFSANIEGKGFSCRIILLLFCGNVIFQKIFHCSVLVTRLTTYFTRCTESGPSLRFVIPQVVCFHDLPMFSFLFCSFPHRKVYCSSSHGFYSVDFADSTCKPHKCCLESPSCKFIRLLTAYNIFIIFQHYLAFSSQGARVCWLLIPFDCQRDYAF